MHESDYPLIGCLAHSPSDTLLWPTLYYCNLYGKLEATHDILSVTVDTLRGVELALSYMTQNPILASTISSLLQGCSLNFLLSIVLS